MATDVRFAFVCKRKWQELTGDDPVQRFCDECHLDIINLDPLTQEERDRLFRDAIRTGEKLCVFATVPSENATRCEANTTEPLDDHEEYPMTGGMPIIDDFEFDDSDEEEEPGMKRLP